MLAPQTIVTVYDWLELNSLASLNCLYNCACVGTHTDVDQSYVNLVCAYFEAGYARLHIIACACIIHVQSMQASLGS